MLTLEDVSLKSGQIRDTKSKDTRKTFLMMIIQSNFVVFHFCIQCHVEGFSQIWKYPARLLNHTCSAQCAYNTKVVWNLKTFFEWNFDIILQIFLDQWMEVNWL